MNINHRPPVLVPVDHRAEVEEMSKAALMDLVWWLCASRPALPTTLDEFRFQRRRVEIMRQDWHREDAPPK